MQTSEESSCPSVCTQNGFFVKSPISKLLDQGIDTPQKLPAAPHPSPINMDTESSNPKSKEMFRTELLRACLLKIPEAVADESVFNDYLSTSPSTPCRDPISDLPECPQGQYFPRLYKKAKLESEWVAKDEIPINPEMISHMKDSPVNFNPRECFKLCEKDLEENLDKYSSANLNDFDGKNECSKIVSSLSSGTNGSVLPPYIIVNSISKQDGGEQLHGPSIDRLEFYDHTTDHQEISRLLNVNSEGKEHSDSIFGGRSPGSDNLSTIAVCASDASDISDEDLSTRSMDLQDMERSVDLPSNPGKKKSRSAMRRFLNWRRSLKFRKRAASLDENRFPFLANRFDSYKTEFELSV